VQTALFQSIDTNRAGCYGHENGLLFLGESPLDDLYRTYFVPYFWIVDLFWCSCGLAYILWPTRMVGPSVAGLILNDKVAQKFGWSPDFTGRVLAISERREQLRYDNRIARTGGALCFVVGLLGFLRPINPAIITSGAMVIVAWTAALYSASANRIDNNYIASLDVRHPNQIVPVWFFAANIMAAFALLYLQTFASVFVGSSMLAITAAVWRITSIPAVYFGSDVVLERHIDARFRLSRVLLLVSLMQFPLIVWTITTYANGFQHSSTAFFIVRMIVQLAQLCQIGFMLFIVPRYNRDLRRIAATTN
jgi:hypothetical protein